MNGSNPFSRVLSLRDKRRTPSKSRTDITSLFAIDEKAKKPSKDEEKKIQDITLRLASLGVHDVPPQRIEYALRSKSAQGDPKEAIRLLMLYGDSLAGLLRPYDPSIKMLGAENREKTTCYLDSLLFAMFAKPDVFEAVLFNTFEDEPRKRLVVIMRLWVNLLRTGRLVTTDVMAKLQEALADCGWADAGKIRQQDASEAFSFITDKLELPLLTLKTDIYHAGKEDDKDDHKFITERMLDVAIPDNVPAGEMITLEMCLEEYFNNRVEVKRHLQRRGTIETPGSRKDSVDKSGALYVETVEVDSRGSSPARIPKELNSKPLTQRPFMRARATSIFSERRVSPSREASKEGAVTGVDASGRPRASSVRKEVLMPAWQFLNLIPWYTDNASPENDAQVRAHFSKRRPMLGICLKRYSVSPNGISHRLNTYIDIPLEMAPPHFAAGDNLENEGPLTGNFKLSLQSIVCHRGHSVDSGHYIAIIRANSLSSDQFDSFADPASSQTLDQSHDAWLRFDDLASERVQAVDINKALRQESPYLLFYRVEPIHEPPLEHLPPYEASNESFELVDEKLSNLSNNPERSRESFEPIDLQSRRTSADATSPEDSRGRSSLSSLRRSSVQWQVGTGAESIKTDQGSTEPTTPLDEMKTAPSMLSMLSRSTTKTSRSDSHRPPSDSSEKRFSVSMSKISSRLSSNKLAGPDILVDEVIDDSPPVVAMPPKEESPDALKMKSKEKKRKFLSGSRRGSASQKTGKQQQPDRECILM